ncbi:MAG: hypothetical protein MPJ50_07560 [Pirellulales bacterium]|nr:hypothetical protein [Pirellulales bacterium]
MPATEQTWRDQKRMHLIFGISSLLMLLFTVWMLIQDHDREWKQYQEDYYSKLEVWDLQSRILEQTTDLAYTNGLGSRQDILAKYEIEVPAESLLQLLYAELRYDDARLAMGSEAQLPGGCVNEWGELSAARAVAMAELTATLRQAGLTSQRIVQAAVDSRLAELEGRQDAEAEQRLQRATNDLADTIANLADEADTFFSEAERQLEATKADGLIADIQSALADLQAAGDQSATTQARAVLDEVLDDARAQALFREQTLQQSLKFMRAEFDGEFSLLGIAINNGDPPADVAKLKASVEGLQSTVAKLNFDYEAANSHRLKLDQVVGIINSNVNAATKAVASFKLDLDNLEKAYQAAAGTGDRIGRGLVTLPILDAFNNSEIEVKHIWLPDLTQNYNHKQVARFDRCITCHLGIDKTAPGTVADPNYEAEHLVTNLVLATPEAQPDVEPNTPPNDLLMEFYGFSLAAQGIFDPDDALIEVVAPRTVAANALLKRGDVIDRVYVDGVSVRITSIDQAYRYLLDNVEWGQAITLDIRRGVKQPFSAHPRLDLYGADSSPHPFKDIGCTICHEGQGNATQFKWASHSPNDLNELSKWSGDHEWFDNHHWIYPMYPERFLESSCLRCHHSVAELSPSERFPDPPAPKLMAGYDLVRTYGCFGCHEVNGYAGTGETIGPDLRLEPNYVPAAQSLHIDPRLTDNARQARGSSVFMGRGIRVLQNEVDVRKAEVERFNQEIESLRTQQSDIRGEQNKLRIEAEQDQRLNEVQPQIDAFQSQNDDLQSQIEQRQDEVKRLEQELVPLEEELGFKKDVVSLSGRIISNVDDTPARHQLEQLVTADSLRAALSSQGPSYLRSELHKLGSVLADQDVPGGMRKSGPSLRYLASKIDEEFLYGWIMQPNDFRPDTKMPQFFGQYGHFLPYSPEGGKGFDEPRHTQGLEQVEAYALTHYLQAISQEFAYDNPADMPEGVLPADVERGKWLFESKGCLACHSHGSFPEATQNQGPDLSNLGSKLKGEKGRQWLTSWLRDPNRYHARTKMPNVFLTPERLLGPTGLPLTAGGPAAGDPVNTDVSTAPFYDPAADIAAYLLAQDNGWTPKHAIPDKASDEFKSAMEELALEHLEGAFTRSQARRFLAEGIPPELGVELKGDEVELVGEFADDSAAREEHLLNYLGRKTVSKYGCYGCHDIAGFEASKPIGTALADWGRKDASKLAFEQVSQLIHVTDMNKDQLSIGHAESMHGNLFQMPALHGGDHDSGDHGDHSSLSVQELSDRGEPGLAYFLNSLLAHQRTGFLWQKLRAPRSYDYSKTEQKSYNERLKMPMFPFDEAERESVMTFVLGLVADPPAPKYVYNPSERQQAINAGNIVLEKYNCTGCHELEPDKWTFNYDPEMFAEESPFPSDEYEVFRQFHTQQEVAQSRELDARGLGTATVYGRKTTDEEGVVVLVEGDEETDPTSEFIDLWKPALIHGQGFLAGDSVEVRSDRFVSHLPARGGFFANYIHDRALGRVRQVNNAAKYLDAWGWGPPPLFNEGEKVQTEWLYNFMLEPVPLRPAAVLRMPKFNLSRDEARALANYFAARDNAHYPYDFESRSLFQTDESRLSTSGEALEADAETLVRLKDAMTIVTNSNYCIKCHKIGDYSPGGDLTALAPNLERTYERIRPEFLYPWLANPKRKLPYTGMPVNFPRDKPIRPDLFSVPTGDLIHGGLSEDQLQAVVDLLLNYDWYMRRGTSIVPLINQSPVGATTDGSSPAPNDE